MRSCECDVCIKREEELDKAYAIAHSKRVAVPFSSSKPVESKYREEFNALGQPYHSFSMG